MTKLPYMEFYVDDYDAATMHLTPEEDGIYIRLLRLAWRTPKCSLPNDAVWIARKMRMVGDFDAKIEPILREFFRLSSGRWMQKKQQAIYRRSRTAVEAKKKRARAGGIAKALKSKGKRPAKSSAKELLKPACDLPTRTRTRTSKEEKILYAFSGNLIRLNQEDHDRWKLAFHAIPDFNAELQSLDDYYDRTLKGAERKKWFIRTSTRLKNKHQEAIERRDSKALGISARSNGRLDPVAANNRWGAWQVGHWKPEWGDKPTEMGCKTLESYLTKVTAAKGEAA